MGLKGSVFFYQESGEEGGQSVDFKKPTKVKVEIDRICEEVTMEVDIY